MNLDLINNFFNTLKENKFVRNFINELSNYLITGNIDLTSDDLTLCGTKVISKFKNQILTQRSSILQKYAKQTAQNGNLYYIYGTSQNEKDSYNLCIYNSNSSLGIITKPTSELPTGVNLGDILRKHNENLVLDPEATLTVRNEIDSMIKEKLFEQNEYLKSNRLEGHIYEVGEKYSGRIWLYDLNVSSGGGIEGFEEIKFPQDLYVTAQEGDTFIYENGSYKRFENYNKKID